jgi:hypothetical protein
MDPEGSVSALIFHHPQARYFSLSAEDVGRLERRLATSDDSVPLNPRTPGRPAPGR